MDSGCCVAEVAVGGAVLALGKQVDKVEAEVKNHYNVLQFLKQHTMFYLGSVQ